MVQFQALAMEHVLRVVDKLLGGGRVSVDVSDGELVVDAQSEPEKLLPVTVG